jgi:predicted Fe-Mo cluster-binding NifX family protein
MKVAVASDDKTEITGHVGKCKGFLIYEIDNNRIVRTDYRINQFTNHARGKDTGSTELNREGHDAHKNLAEGLKDCRYLISHGMGRRLVEDLAIYMIEPIITSELIPEQAVVKLIRGKLQTEETLICRGHAKK